MTKALTSVFDLDAKLTQWTNAKAQADAWAQIEKDLRTEIFAHEFPTPERGTNKKKINHGMALVAKYGFNYRIDRPMLETLMQDSNVAPLINDVISFSPKVKDAAWEALSADDKKLLAPMLTETPAMPSIEIKPQNKVRW